MKTGLKGQITCLTKNHNTREQRVFSQKVKKIFGGIMILMANGGDLDY